jgi:hypothetical protein
MDSPDVRALGRQVLAAIGELTYEILGMIAYTVSKEYFPLLEQVSPYNLIGAFDVLEHLTDDYAALCSL